MRIYKYKYMKFCKCFFGVQMRKLFSAKISSYILYKNNLVQMIMQQYNLQYEYEQYKKVLKGLNIRITRIGDI